jgi:lysophospholipase L1-like esterase
MFQVITNSVGFSGKEFTREKPDGSLRVVCMGNSSTFGWGVPPDSCYARLLEVSLNEKLGRPVQVINAGIPGYSSLQGFVQYERNILELDPDIITLSFMANDNLPSAKPDSEILRERQGMIGFTQEILNYSCTYRAMKYLIVAKKLKSERGEDRKRSVRRVRPAVSRASLTQLIKIARKNDTEVFFVAILPDSRDWDPYRTVFQDLSRELDVPLLDTQDLFDDFLANLENQQGTELSYILETEKKYSERIRTRHPDIYVRNDRVHPSSLGHLLTARALSAMISDRIVAEGK